MRKRIYEATLDLVTSIGFDAVDVDQIVARAGVEREQFDSLFPSKEACAIAVFEDFMDVFNRRVAEAYESQPGWPDSLRAAAYAVALWMTEHPREMRFGATGLLWAGEAAQAKREIAFQNFVAMIDAGRSLASDPELLPAFTAEGVIGSIAEMITRRAQGPGDLRPYDFVPQLMAVAVRPYLGEVAAARELTMPPPTQGSI